MTRFLRKGWICAAPALILLLAAPARASLTPVNAGSETSLYSTADSHLILLAGMSGTSNPGPDPSDIMNTLYGAGGANLY